MMLLMVVTISYAQDFKKPVWSGSRDIKKVALTFDDGPFDPQTSELLGILKKYNAKASFFVVGDSARKNPHLLKKIINEGHELANHTFSHRRLDTLTKKEIRKEMVNAEKIVSEITGKKMTYFRPPGGRYNQIVLEVASDLHLKTVLWDVNAGDYRYQKQTDDNGERLLEPVIYQRSSDIILSSVMAKTKNGSIILFHNIGGETPKALAVLLASLKEKGIECVTLSGLLEKKS